MTWQKAVRVLLAVGLVALVAGVSWYLLREREAAPVTTVSPRTDEEAESEIAGDEFVRTENGAVIFRLKYEHGYTYPAQSRVRLTGVSGTIARGSQPVEFRADEADVTLKSGNMLDLARFDLMHLRGNVVIKAGSELYMATPDAQYNDLTGIMETTSRVTMKRGRMSGSGTGATFDRDRSVVWLLADAKVAIETAGQGTLKVTSARAGLAEADKYMRFEEQVRMEREGRVIEADAAVANLTPDGAGITSLELTGNSRISGGGSGGGVPNMQADDITITYGAESGLLERAVLMRAARVDLPGADGRRLAADYIDMGFGGDGSSLTALNADGAVELTIPAAGDDAGRVIRAPKLEAAGAVPRGLDRATFTGGVEFEERAAATGARGAVNRTVRSETLVLGLDGGFNQIKDADFTGAVRFKDADVTAEAPAARYGVDTKRVALRGGNGTARVVEAGGTVEAKEIDLTLDPRTMKARTEVKSTLSGRRRDAKGKNPAILNDNEPTHVTARALDYDSATGRAVYTGDARLWQTDTIIQAETIVLDDTRGNLEARKTVRGQFLIRDAGASSRTPAKPTLATSDELVYDEARRQATFSGKARLNGPEGDITGDRIELFLEADGNTLDRAEAYDDVTARLQGGRVAKGTRLTYTAAARRYDMRGKPLSVRRLRVENGATRCEETLGASLTFDRSADTVTVLGANGAPSRTVPVPCTATK